MDSESIAVVTQPCARCGVELDVTASSPGAWLACPGCGQPVLVRAQPARRPDPPPMLAPSSALPEIASPFEKLGGEGLVSATDGATAAAAPWAKGDRSSRRRPRRFSMATVTLTLVAALANAAYAALFLPASRPDELIQTGMFGGLLGLFVATMSASAARKDELAHLPRAYRDGFSD